MFQNHSLNWLLVAAVVPAILIGSACSKSGLWHSFRNTDPDPFPSATGKTVIDGSDSDLSSEISDMALHPRWHLRYESAVSESRSSGKPIMMVFTGSDWCHYCVKLDDEVFEMKDFNNWAREKVVLLKLDYPRRTPQLSNIEKQNRKLLDQYQQYVKGYPTAVFIDADGNYIGKMGYAQGGPKNWIKLASRSLKSSQVSVSRKTDDAQIR